MQTLDFFIEHIGETIYREGGSKWGIEVKDIKHAEYLYTIYMYYYNKGDTLKYTGN